MWPSGEWEMKAPKMGCGGCARGSMLRALNLLFPWQCWDGTGTHSHQPRAPFKLHPKVQSLWSVKYISMELLLDQVLSQAVPRKPLSPTLPVLPR